MEIHKFAQLSPQAQLDQDVSIGPFSLIEAGVTIGSGTNIGSNVLIAKGSVLGRDCSIHHGAVIGSVPQDLKFHGEETTLEIGDRTVIREYATLNRGTSHRMKTRIGSDCLLMAYVHVAHDCIIKDNVVISNCTQMAGHVTVEDYVRLSGCVLIQQFSRIGQHSFVSGGCRITKDVPPFIKAAGEPPSPVGLNVGKGQTGPVGLEKHGISKEAVEILKKAYKIIFRSDMNTSQATETVKAEIEQTEEVKALIEFIESSERGIIK